MGFKILIMEKVYKVIAYLNANSKTYQNEEKLENTSDNGVESISYWNVDGLAQLQMIHN